MCPRLSLTTTHQRDALRVASNCDQKTPPFGTFLLPWSQADGLGIPFSDAAVGLTFLDWPSLSVVLLLSGGIDPTRASCSPAEMKRTTRVDESDEDWRGHVLDMRRSLPPIGAQRSGSSAMASPLEQDCEWFDESPQPKKLSAKHHR